MKPGAAILLMRAGTGVLIGFVALAVAGEQKPPISTAGQVCVDCHETANPGIVAQWHGFYEVAKHFYTKFLPEAEELSAGITDAVLARTEHSWKKGLTAEEIQRILQFYKRRYAP